MGLVVFSDSHGDINTLIEIIESNPCNDTFVHCGDGWEESQRIKKLYPDKVFHTVTGNCDWGRKETEHSVFSFRDEKIAVTHGHLYGVKSNLHELAVYAKEEDVRICFYGHTHRAKVQKLAGIWFVNPGFSSRILSGSPSYARVGLGKNQPIVEFISL